MNQELQIYRGLEPLTQDDIARAHIKASRQNAGQIKHAANIFGLVALLYLVAKLILIYTGH